MVFFIFCMIVFYGWYSLRPHFLVPLGDSNLLGKHNHCTCHDFILFLPFKSSINIIIAFLLLEIKFKSEGQKSKLINFCPLLWNRDSLFGTTKRGIKDQQMGTDGVWLFVVVRSQRLIKLPIFCVASCNTVPVDTGNDTWCDCSLGFSCLNFLELISEGGWNSVRLQYADYSRVHDKTCNECYSLWDLFSMILELATMVTASLYPLVTIFFGIRLLSAFKFAFFQPSYALKLHYVSHFIFVCLD